MNKKYLLYLFKSKKSLCTAICLLYLFTYVLCFTVDKKAGSEIGLIVTSCIFGLLTLVTVPIVYSFVHNKKAVDSYFSLPVTRKEMLITSQLFINLIVTVPYLLLAITSLVIGGMNHHISMYSAYVVYLLIAIVGAIVMIMFVTSIFLEANTTFDGIVLIIAYLTMPLLIYLAIETFQEQLIAGMNPVDSGKVLTYISLPASLIGSEIDYGEIIYHQQAIMHSIPLSLVLCLAWHSGVSVVALRRNFIERKVERAESVSNRLFSYPFVINFYTFVLILAITVNNYIGIKLDALITYFVVFVVYMVANFIYRRKIQILFKDFALYLLAIVIVFAFSFIANSTKGFGLSYAYDHNPKNVAASLEYYCYLDDDKKDPDDELQKMILEVEPGVYNYSIHLDGLIKEKDMDQAKDVLLLLEDKRNVSIANHYDSNRELYNSYLSIVTNYDENKVHDFYEINNNFKRDRASYSYSDKLTYKDIELLKDYFNIRIEIDSSNGFVFMSYEELINKYQEARAQS